MLLHTGKGSLTHLEVPVKRSARSPRILGGDPDVLARAWCGSSLGRVFNGS